MLVSSGKVAAALVLLTASAADGREALNKKWLSADLEVARVWGRNLGPPGDATPDDYARKLGAVGKPEVRDLGFGASTVDLVRPGGYFSFRFTLLVHAGRIARWRAWAWANNDGAWAKVRRDLPAAWGGLGRDLAGEPGTSPNTYEHIWSDERRMAALHAAFDAALGRVEGTEPVPAELAGAMEMLTSPFSLTHVGTNCYEGGVPPRGRTAVEEIVAAGRNDLLREVARSLNPEGRVYAARALLRLPAPMRLPADRLVVEAIRASGVRTWACTGCMLHLEPAAVLLKR